jgi:hypothetical protein
MSLSSSSHVDQNNPWPRGVESRPSIADIPRLEVKVLQWGGVL